MGEFDLLSKQLISRKLTGHATDEIMRLMKKSNANEWNYKRILQKDMRCGYLKNY